MTDSETKEVVGFLAIPSGTNVKVRVNDDVYDLGFIDRIHATSGRYVVWEDHEGRIWYETSDRNVIEQEDFHKFWNRFQLARVRSTKNLDTETKLPYQQMLSSAIASALEGQFMAASEALDAASDFLTTANERVSRSRYTFGAISATFVFVIASAIILSENNLQPLVSIASTAMLGGSLGALLSALAGKKTKLGFDPNASRLEGQLNGALRVLYGIVSAFLVVLAIESGVISTPLISDENKSLSLILVAAAGGFAERWAADLIKRFATAPRSDEQ